MLVKGVESERKLAKISRVDQKTINNLLTKPGMTVKLETINAIAKALNLEPWHLLLDLPDIVNANLPKNLDLSDFALLEMFSHLNIDEKKELIAYVDFKIKSKKEKATTLSIVKSTTHD